MCGRRERRTIDALLSGAEVLAEDYDEGDVAAVRERVLAVSGTPPASVPPEDSPAAAPAASADHTAARARHYPTECEQAAHDLDLAVSLVINAPEAAVSLTRLVDDQESIAPE